MRDPEATRPNTGTAPSPETVKEDDLLEVGAVVLAESPRDLGDCLRVVWVVRLLAPLVLTEELQGGRVQVQPLELELVHLDGSEHRCGVERHHSGLERLIERLADAVVVEVLCSSLPAECQLEVVGSKPVVDQVEGVPAEEDGGDERLDALPGAHEASRVAGAAVVDQLAQSEPAQSMAHDQQVIDAADGELVHGSALSRGPGPIGGGSLGGLTVDQGSTPCSLPRVSSWLLVPGLDAGRGVHGEGHPRGWPS